ELNFNALKDFMTRVHPNYALRDFYLTGQSYAGFYIPWLSRRLLRGIQSGDMKNTNFRGFTESGIVAGAALAHLTYGTIPQKYTDVIFRAWQKVQKGEELDLNMWDHDL
ncbi:hypothetical protein PENTCL1PPCAC_5980, partial [Pristionchus entomophagus]